MSIDLKVTVDELIALPFSSRSLQDQIRIVSDGRPRPNVKLSTLNVTTGTPKVVLGFKRNVYDEMVWRCREVNSVQSLYEEMEWLTFSTTSRNFYCWPCLLFQPPGVWNHTGISNIVLLTEGAREHEKASDHIEAVFRLQMFIGQNWKAENDTTDTTSKNPEVLKRIIDVVCSLAAVLRPPSETNNSRSLFEVEKCMQIMQLLRTYDSLDKCHSDDAIDMIKKYPEVIEITANAVAKVLKLSLIKEISSSKYVSLILSQHSNVRLNAQISAVVRYVKDAKVCEKFLGFSHIFQSASVDTIYKYIMSIVHEFEITSKCIAVSLDAAILPTDGVISLFKRLKIEIQNCIFVPWHSHNVDYVLQKTLSKDKKCQHVFKTIMAVEAYLCENTELCRAFDDFVTENELESISLNARCDGNWYVKSDFVTYVVKHRQQLVKFFDSVIANSSKWDANDITQALGFRESLQDLSTVFLFIVFSKIFSLTSTLNTALASDTPERNFGKGIVHELINNLNEMHQSNFKDLWTIAVTEVGGDVDTNSRKGFKHIPFFNEVMKSVTGEIKVRYSILDNFQFCSMFDFEVDGWLEEAVNRLQSLVKFYTIDFNRPQTQSEMLVVWKHNAFLKKSVYDFHEYLHESKLKHSLKALFDLSELILALPVKQISPGCKISTLNKIGKWSFGPEHVSECDSVSIVFVESDYLQEIKQLSTFYDEVIDIISL